MVPALWRSHRLRRTMSSTLAPECHAMMDGLGCFKLTMCLWCEFRFPDFKLQDKDQC